MKRIFLILLAIAACQCVIPKKKTTTEIKIERQGFVDVRKIDPTIRVSLMYGRSDNFTGKTLYNDLHTAYLHPSAAYALKKAQKELKRLHPNLSLIVFDAARPMSIQKKMWNAVAGTSKYFYVSNPRNGGGLHNYGLAVDISICNSKGDTIPMGTKVDYMGRLSHINLERQMLKSGKLSRKAFYNRALLRKVMRAGGFRPLRTEWWHFNFKTRAQAKAYYKVIR